MEHAHVVEVQNVSRFGWQRHCILLCEEMYGVQSFQLRFGGYREARVPLVSPKSTEWVPREVEHDLLPIGKEQWCFDWGPFAVVLITIVKYQPWSIHVHIAS